MVLTLIIIHVLELAAVLIYLLIRKNAKLEKIIQNQQSLINTTQYLIQQSDEKLKELDNLGTFKSDDEIGFFFENIKQIQKILNDVNSL